MPIKNSLYRRPPTPNGLKAIETKTLEWYSPELYANMNSGVLEEYLEEKNIKAPLHPLFSRIIAIGAKHKNGEPIVFCGEDEKKILTDLTPEYDGS